MTYIKVKEEPHLVRDSRSQAILNINTDAYEAYKKERVHRLEIKAVVDGFPQMKSDIEEIKSLLKLLVVDKRKLML
jgi:hypothetical protein